MILNNLKPLYGQPCGGFSIIYTIKLVTMYLTMKVDISQITALPVTQINNIEIEALCVDEVIEGVTHYQRYESDNPKPVVAWSVYLRNVSGEAVCVADCDTQATALALYDLLKYAVLNMAAVNYLK